MGICGYSFHDRGQPIRRGRRPNKPKQFLTTTTPNPLLFKLISTPLVLVHFPVSDGFPSTSWYRIEMMTVLQAHEMWGISLIQSTVQNALSGGFLSSTSARKMRVSLPTITRRRAYNSNTIKNVTRILLIVPLPFKFPCRMDRR